jgi:S1-C subfamily serine protease
MLQFEKRHITDFIKTAFVHLFYILIIVFLFLSLKVNAEERKQLASVPAPLTLAPVVEKVAPSVVTITSSKIYRVRERNMFYDDPFIRRFFGMPDQPNATISLKKMVWGSGVIVREDGYILTNAHVIDGADGIIVRHYDNSYEAVIVGFDRRTDLAVLKIDAKNLTKAEFTDSDSVRVGDFVLAIGHPFGLEHTVTFGIISAKDRFDMGLADYEDFLQTDASINPGNSGGALVDLYGRIVGINTAIASQSGGFQVWVFLSHQIWLSMS